MRTLMVSASGTVDWKRAAMGTFLHRCTVRGVRLTWSMDTQAVHCPDTELVDLRNVSMTLLHPAS